MNEFTTKVKKRAKFITLWLWLMLLSNIIIAIVQITSADLAIWKYASEDNAKTFFFVEHSMVDFYICMAYVICGLTIVNAIAYIFVMKWKKLGFWMLVCGVAIYIVVLIAFGFAGGWTSRVVISFIWVALEPIVLWKVLRAEKDGITCWEQLE